MLRKLQQELDQLEVLGRLVSSVSARDRANGKVTFSERTLIDFSCWDCLNLRSNQKIKRALVNTISEQNAAASAARAHGGSSREQITSEGRLANFLGQEAAFYSTSRNQALLTIGTSITSSADVIIAENALAGVLADVALMAESEIYQYSAFDLRNLERLLERFGFKRRKFVFVESVSRLTGEVLPLDRINTLCVAHGAYLCVDESAALAITGDRGAGSLDIGRLEQSPFCQFGDLSLGLAAYGGFIAGPGVLITYLQNRSASYRHESAAPPMLMTLLLTQLDLSESLVLERNQLRERASDVSDKLAAAGLSVISGEGGPIITLAFKKFSMARDFVRGLISQGIYAAAFGPHDIRSDFGYVQFLINISHSDKNLRMLCAACDEVWHRLEAE